MESSKQINLDDIKRAITENIISWKETKSLIIKKLKEYTDLHNKSKEAVRDNKIELAKIHIKSKVNQRNSILKQIDFMSNTTTLLKNYLDKQLKENPILKENIEFKNILSNNIDATHK